MQTDSNSETLAQYLYDADNRRMEKVVENGGLPDDSSLDGTTRYYYHGLQVLEERDGSGDLLRQYTWGNYLDEVWTIDDRSGSIAVADLNNRDGSDRHFAHANTLYHVHGLTDEEGNLVEGYQYDAYGKATVFTGKGNDNTWFTSDDTPADWSAKSNPYQYTGQRYDPETGLMYYKNRYYDTNLGRFIIRDLIGYEDSMNLYEYVNSRPILYSDPRGLSTLQIDGDGNIVVVINPRNRGGGRGGMPSYCMMAMVNCNANPNHECCKGGGRGGNSGGGGGGPSGPREPKCKEKPECENLEEKYNACIDKVNDWDKDCRDRRNVFCSAVCLWGKNNPACFYCVASFTFACRSQEACTKSFCDEMRKWCEGNRDKKPGLGTRVKCAGYFGDPWPKR